MCVCVCVCSFLCSDSLVYTSFFSFLFYTVFIHVIVHVINNYWVGRIWPGLGPSLYILKYVINPLLLNETDFFLEKGFIRENMVC